MRLAASSINTHSIAVFNIHATVNARMNKTMAVNASIVSYSAWRARSLYKAYIDIVHVKVVDKHRSVQRPHWHVAASAKHAHVEPLKLVASDDVWLSHARFPRLAALA